MSATVKLPPLWTPEQVEEQLGYDPGGKPVLSRHAIKRLARRGEVVHQRGPKNRILFTPAQAQALVDSMIFQPDPALAQQVDPEKVEVLGFRTSKRSRRK